MSESQAVQFTEDRIPLEGIGGAAEELVELYGGTMTGSGESERRFTLPLRRGMAAGGGVECTLSWGEAAEEGGTVTLTCDRDVDAPRFQRVLLLVAGVIGALLFMLWPFYPGENAFGTLAWLGGAVAIAFYLMTLRRTMKSAIELRKQFFSSRETTAYRLINAEGDGVPGLIVQA